MAGASTPPVRVGWIFSLIRSGSSATAYAAAAPWSHPVADEPLGPWVRTGPVYGYPKTQGELVRAFEAAKWRLSPEVVRLARELFAEMGAATGAVVAKHPHLDFTPREFDAAFEDHGAVWLLRNPLHRLNSIYARGLLDSLRPNHELEHYTAFARNWLGRPERERLVYDHLKNDARGLLGRMWEAWGWPFREEHLNAATSYLAGHYHSSCKETEDSSGARPVSESAARLPEAAIETYLEDPFIRDLMERVGWSTDAEAYVPLTAGARA